MDTLQQAEMPGLNPLNQVKTFGPEAGEAANNENIKVLIP